MGALLETCKTMAEEGDLELEVLRRCHFDHWGMGPGHLK